MAKADLIQGQQHDNYDYKHISQEDIIQCDIIANIIRILIKPILYMYPTAH